MPYPPYGPTGRSSLPTRLHDHRQHPSVAARLLAAADLPDLLARHAELFEGLELPGG